MLVKKTLTASQMTHYALVHYVLNHVVYELYTIILSFMIRVW